MTDVFQKGCLVQLSVPVWGGVKKIDPKKIAELVKETDHDWLTASKKLVSPESLKPIDKIKYSARSWLYFKSLPFPVRGLSFVPKDLINDVDNKLKEFKEEFDQAVLVFKEDYNDLRESAKEFLGELFDEVDYPIDISTKFDFVWRFVVLELPKVKSRILAPEVYAREKEKFVQTMEEARKMAVHALREEFAYMVEKVSDRFASNGNGKPKVFRNSTVESFYEYFQTFKNRNIFQDEELAELVSMAQGVLNGTTADQIRSDSDLKEKIRVDMTEIESSILQLLNRPRRRIVLDQPNQ